MKKCPSPGRDYHHLLEDTVQSAAQSPSSHELQAENAALKQQLHVLSQENALQYQYSLSAERYFKQVHDQIEAERTSLQSQIQNLKLQCREAKKQCQALEPALTKPRRTAKSSQVNALHSQKSSQTASSKKRISRRSRPHASQELDRVSRAIVYLEKDRAELHQLLLSTELATNQCEAAYIQRILARNKQKLSEVRQFQDRLIKASVSDRH